MCGDSEEAPASTCAERSDDQVQEIRVGKSASPVLSGNGLAKDGNPSSSENALERRPSLSQEIDEDLPDPHSFHDIYFQNCSILDRNSPRVDGSLKLFKASDFTPEVCLTRKPRGGD
jgi:hypothetical protein